MHLPPARVREIFELIDTDGNGWISYGEFSVYVDAHDKTLRTAFAAIDTDDSGSISKDEVQGLLDRINMHCTSERRDAVIRTIDRDGDGVITYDEFRTAFALLDHEDLLRSLDDS